MDDITAEPMHSGKSGLGKSPEHNEGSSSSPYSVLMSVYAKEQSSYLRESLTSMLTQTMAPDQIVVVEDGPLTTQLTATIKGFQKQYPDIFTIVPLSQNSGLGTALAQGILACRNEIVVRMDSDDYSFPQRVQKEIAAMERQQLDIVGSQIVEFIDSPDTPVSESNLPCKQEDITAYSKRRNPFRHPSVAFRKTKVLLAGNYSKEYLYFEDWDLFNRMLAADCRAANIDEPLVAMRVSSNFYERRGGLAYIGHIWKFKYAQYRKGYFTFFQFIATVAPHIAVCILPNGVRSLIYAKLLRKGVHR